MSAVRQHCRYRETSQCHEAGRGPYVDLTSSSRDIDGYDRLVVGEPDPINAEKNDTDMAVARQQFTLGDRQGAKTADA
jgi:hypothetical protein